MGVAYAAANIVTGSPVVITNNHNAGNTPTLNDLPTGNLIFGAITTDTIPWVFCGNWQPSCGEGRVMVDASGSGGLHTANNNEWGIAFQQTSPPTNALLRITRIEIDVGAGAQFSGTLRVTLRMPGVGGAVNISAQYTLNKTTAFVTGDAAMPARHFATREEWRAALLR